MQSGERSNYSPDKRSKSTPEPASDHNNMHKTELE